MTQEQYMACIVERSMLVDKMFHDGGLPKQEEERKLLLEAMIDVYESEELLPRMQKIWDKYGRLLRAAREFLHEYQAGNPNGVSVLDAYEMALVEALQDSDSVQLRGQTFGPGSVLRHGESGE